MSEQPRSSWCGLELPHNLDLNFADDIENLLDWVAAPNMQQEATPDALCCFSTPGARTASSRTAAASPDHCSTALGLQGALLSPELSPAVAHCNMHQASPGCWCLATLGATTEPTTGMPALPRGSQHSTPQSQTRSGFTSVVLAAAGRYLPQHEIAAAVAHHQCASPPGAQHGVGSSPAACMGFTPFAEHSAGQQLPAHAVSCKPQGNSAGQLLPFWPGYEDGSSSPQQQQQVSTGPRSWFPEAMDCAGMSGTGMGCAGTGCAGTDTEDPSTPAGQTALPSSYMQAEGSMHCAGMGCPGIDTETPHTPAGWTALPGSCMQADTQRMHSSCCPLGPACAGVYCLACFEAEMRGAKAAGGGSSTGSNASASPCILQAPAGAAGQQGARSPFLSLGSAGSASTSPAAGAGNAAGVLTAAARSGPVGAGAGACSSPPHVTMPSMCAHMHSTEAGDTGSFADTARQLLAVSEAAAAAAAAAAASDPFGPAAQASAGDQTVPCATQANVPAAATETQQGTNSSGSERLGKRLNPSAQMQSTTASLGRTANKVIVKNPRRKSNGSMQNKVQPAHPPAAPKGFAEGGSTVSHFTDELHTLQY